MNRTAKNYVKCGKVMFFCKCLNSGKCAGVEDLTNIRYHMDLFGGIYHVCNLALLGGTS